MKSIIPLVFAVCVASVVSQGYKKSATVCFDRDVKANVCGKVKFGPCGRPKSNVNVDLKDCGRTNIGGNMFQVLESAGRVGEVFKLVGNRFKPLSNCPPRPPSNDDMSGESLVDGAIREQARRPALKVLRIRTPRVKAQDVTLSGFSDEDNGCGRRGSDSSSGGHGYGSGSDDGDFGGDRKFCKFGSSVVGGKCGCKRNRGGGSSGGHGGSGGYGGNGGYGGSDSDSDSSDGGNGCGYRRPRKSHKTKKYNKCQRCQRTSCRC